MNLTGAQRRAVEHEGPPLIVLAGPGTGKTRVIIERIAHLVQERGVEPEHVTAVTFTNKAAGELRERLAERVGLGIAERVRASTFHSLGLSLLRRFSDRTGLGNPELADSSQQRRVLRELAGDSGVLGPLPGGLRAAVDEARRTIEALRHAGISPTGAVARAERGIAEAEDDETRARFGVLLGRARLFALYDGACMERGWVTFDDLLVRPTELIERDALAASMIRGECRHVIVDEFQDVNTAQIDMLRALAPPGGHGAPVVVGDDDQSIYAFRGADDRAMERFARIWEGAETIALDVNFRSREPIVGVSSRVISRAHTRFADKDMRADGAQGGPGSVEIVRLKSNPEAGEVIATLIAEARAADTEKKWSDFAVIARSGTELERVRAALTMRGVPVVTRSPETALADQGVQDVLAWVNLVLHPEQTWSARRVLVRPPLSVDVGRVAAWEREHRALASRGENPGEFTEWLESHAGDDPEVGERVRRFAAWVRAFRELAARSPADEVFAEIVRAVGVVHADLVSGRERARRVTGVVGMLRFVRERVGRADEPRDLRAFMRYYEDLDGDDQDFALPGDEAAVEPDVDPRGEFDGGDGVWVLTAHSAKGLEFDTVFVSGVSPKHRFPNTRVDDDDALPEGVVDRADDERSALERRVDEERRLFYVACTRAERRLVLLGEVPEKTSSTHFLHELLDDPGVSWVGGGEILERAAGSDEVERELASYAARSESARVFEEARRAVRLDAAAALARADAPGGDPVEQGGALVEAARRAAVVAHVERTGGAPAWAAGAGLEAFAAALASGSTPGEVAGAGFGGLRAPVRLSYTQISTYLECPRCALVRDVLRLPEAFSEHLVFGRAMHEALESFYGAWREADSEGRARPGRDDLIERARAAVVSGWPRERELDRSVVQRAEDQARLAWEKLHEDDANVVELELKVVFPHAVDGVEHSLVAKIDRVDDLGGRSRIIDYKTGRATEKLTGAKQLKKDMQMGMYVMALRHATGDASLDGVCEYWVLGEGVRGRVAFADLDLAGISSKIDGAIEGMVAGAWERSGSCRKRGADAPCAVLDPA